MKAHWLLSSLAGAFSIMLLSNPAQAGRLQSWQFDNNRLTFSTDEGVQPRVQLLSNPTRLVIDLPDTKLDRPRVSQPGNGTIQSIRVAQFNAETTRIVVELSPGYTIDPQQVRVRGATPTQWSIQIPTPQLTQAAQATNQSANQANQSTTSATPASTQIEELRITPDGLFVRTQGAIPEIEQRWEDDRRRLILELEDTALSPRLTQREVNVDRYGVDNIQFAQSGDTPPTATITLNLNNENSDWRINATNLGGIVLIPGHSVATAQRPSDSRSLTNRRPDPNQPATIQAIELAENGGQLVIRTNRSITNVNSGWDRSSAEYQITIPNARLAENVAQPRTGGNSPFLRFRALQSNANTVTVQFLPAAGIVVGTARSTDEAIALDFQGRRIPAQSTGRTIERSTTAGAPLPNINNGRISVAIDPGHGGRDPGAVGIGGLRETDIVLPIAKRVAEILEQQGVQAILTRTDEREIDLGPRVQLANRSRTNLFVSIHANSISLSRPDVNGAETYYYTDAGRELAQIIQNNVIQTTNMRSRGVRSARFYVLRNTNMPAALVEVGFVTGAEDARLLSDPSFRNRMAEGIARGILQYIQQRF